jgi:hypothetical protein
MYQQEIKTGQSFSFERFLDVVPWKNFDWNKNFEPVVREGFWSGAD